MIMQVAQMELKIANEFIDKHHRHHKPVVGHRFSIGALKDGILVGVCIVGRPVARAVNSRKVIEVTRLCTDGTKNSCSFLYAKAATISKHLGYKYIQTYILEEELGVSLKAVGWKILRTTKGGDWNCPSRMKRRTDQPQGKKICWSRKL